MRSIQMLAGMLLPVLSTFALADIQSSEEKTESLTITNNTIEPARLRIAFADEVGATSTEVTIEPAQQYSGPSGRPLLVVFQSGDKAKQYVLVPGRSYHFALGDDGRIDLHRTEIAGGKLDPDRATRHIGVRAVADAAYRKRFPQWRERIRELMDRASDHFDDNFDIRFKLVACDVWSYQSAGRSANESLTQLFKIAPDDADLLIGFTVIDLPSWQQVELGVTTNFGQHVLIRESTAPALAARAELIVLHELCHVFGAFHVDDPRSVMQPAMESCPHQFTVTQPTREVVRLARNVDLRKGVESLDDATTRMVTELHRAHHDRAGAKDDPITMGYTYQALRASEKGDWRRAWAMAYQVVLRSPKNLGAHLIIGQAALSLNDYAEAANRFREVIHLRPGLSVGHHGLATALMGAGDDRSALKEAEQAVRLDPQNEEARMLRETIRAKIEVSSQIEKQR